MTEPAAVLLGRLAEEHSLTPEEYRILIESYTPEAACLARSLADQIRQKVYGTAVFIRGLIEIGNYCRNDCLYCGIRRSNANCRRYLLSRKDILSCCELGHELGFRTFVLQGGENPVLTGSVVADLVSEIKSRFPDCAVTLSLGEYSREDYRLMKEAGADRYLLRHETADEAHYGKLHPPEQSFRNRMRCLQDLQDLGFQTGCGFMVGSPYQTAEALAKDLKFIEEFRPAMCGIGPFLPHHDTPFRNQPPGSEGLTIYLLSILRLMHPTLLLPATTALGTISPGGRERGIQAGANVVMPNLSPPDQRGKYLLYDNKLCTDAEAAEGLAQLRASVRAVGYEIVTDRGDPAKL